MRENYHLKLLFAGLAVSAAAFAAWMLVGPDGRLSASGEQQWAMLDRFCVECHNDIDLAGNVSFERFTPESVSEHAATFEAMVTKLRGRLMPPPGGPQPEQSEIDGLVAWLESTLDRNVTARVGQTPIQRLSRTEYARAVEDLVGVKIDAAEYLPTDNRVHGFTNIAAALTLSPAFLEQYVDAAREVARLALGESVPKVYSLDFPSPGGPQDDYIHGFPLGTRGGMRFEHNFLADGEYRLTITDLDIGPFPRPLESEQTLVVLVDRQEAFRIQFGGHEDHHFVNVGGEPARAKIMERFAKIPIHVTAGVHEIVVTFIERSRASTETMSYGFVQFEGYDTLLGEQRVGRVVGPIEVEGPFNSTGVSSTASRAKILICTPETRAEERPCAERIAMDLAERAFRRPVTGQDVERLMPFFERGREGSGGFEAGVEQLVAAVLASPDFLLRAIGPPAGAEAEVYALSDLALASRLSFFLWSQGPDAELLELAATGKLNDPATIEAQVRRMLADPRASALVENFALTWLDVDDLDAVEPDPQLFAGFSEELRADFATEIELFLRSVLLEDRDIRELISADYTYLNENLARHYGITTVRGPQFRRVRLEDPRRHGLLGKGAVLMRTSYGNRTSPVLRGAWVLDKLVGTPPSPPPPGVETDLTPREGELPKTIRAQLEVHQASPSCSGCHGVIDPYGVALENFTVIGEWRDYDEEADAPIDTTTVLPDGVSLAGPVELRQALLRRPDQFALAFTQKLMLYALARELKYHDMPQVRALLKAAARQDYRLSAIVVGIAMSDAFRMQAQPRLAEPLQVVADMNSTQLGDQN